MHCLRRVFIRSPFGLLSRAGAAAPRMGGVPIASRLSSPGLRAATIRSFSDSRVVTDKESSDSEESARLQDIPPSKTQPKTSEAATPAALPNGVFVRNIVFDANEAQLKEVFDQFGTILKVVIARDARGLSKGFGFVYFSSPEEVNKAVGDAHGTFWHGRRIEVTPRTAPNATKGRSHLPLAERTPTLSLYVGNIPYETTDAELNKLFRSLDGIRDVRIAVDRSTGWPRGFAHADFWTVEATKAAALKLESHVILGRQLRIDYSESRDPKNRGKRDSQSNTL